MPLSKETKPKQFVDFAVPVDFIVELNETQQISRLCWRVKEKYLEYKSDSNTNYCRSTRDNPQESRKENRRIIKPRETWICPDHRATEIRQEYLEKSWKAEETCSHLDSSENHHLSRMWKPHKESNGNGATTVSSRENKKVFH